MLTQSQKNKAVFAAVFLALTVLQFYYWHARAIPQPNEDGPPPLDDVNLKALISDGGIFIRFFYTDNCGFSRNMFAVVDQLEQKYPLERVNAAKYCWSGSKVLDCPAMVPAFVIYRDGERIEIFGERDAGFIENATVYGKSVLAGVLSG